MKKKVQFKLQKSAINKYRASTCGIGQNCCVPGSECTGKSATKSAIARREYVDKLKDGSNLLHASCATDLDCNTRAGQYCDDTSRTCETFTTLNSRSWPSYPDFTIQLMTQYKTADTPYEIAPILSSSPSPTQTRNKLRDDVPLQCTSRSFALDNTGNSGSSATKDISASGSTAKKNPIIVEMSVTRKESFHNPNTSILMQGSLVR
jgi:hypothetical protein